MGKIRSTKAMAHGLAIRAISVLLLATTLVCYGAKDAKDAPSPPCTPLPQGTKMARDDVLKALESDLAKVHGSAWRGNDKLSVPATLAYTFWTHGFPSQEKLEIHIPGSTLAFEGASDYCWLAKALPPHVKHVTVRLVMASPFLNDGPGGNSAYVWGKYDEGQKYSKKEQNTTIPKKHPSWPFLSQLQTSR